MAFSIESLQSALQKLNTGGFDQWEIFVPAQAFVYR